jgi:DNA polymerase III delta subunit
VFVILERHGDGKRKFPIDKFCETAGIKEIRPEAEKIGKGSKATSVVEVELQRCLIDSGVKIHTEARARIVEHLGDDAARVAELVDVLASRFPIGATVRADEVEPYLGAVGALDKPFALTAAIESGDTAKALDVLYRLMHATSAKSKHNKPVHPMQLMGALTGYYRSLLKLDSPSITSKEDAATVLGGNPWAAKYRLDSLRRIGSNGLHQAFGHLAQADLDLRGQREIDEDAVMQILVARLCALGKRGSAAKAPAGASRR